MKRIILTAELIKEEEGGYTVYCPELDIYTQGEDVEEAIKNLKEAAELHIEELGIEFKLGASPSSSLCHCEAFTLSSLRGALRRSNLQECPTTGIATPTARNDRKRRLAMTEKGAPLPIVIVNIKKAGGFPNLLGRNSSRPLSMELSNEVK